VLPVRYENHLHILKYKALPVTIRGGLQSYETLKIPHCLVSELTDGGELFTLTRRAHSYRIKGLGRFKKFSYLIRS
jgi:hypothetical protein